MQHAAPVENISPGGQYDGVAAYGNTGSGCNYDASPGKGTVSTRPYPTDDVVPTPITYIANSYLSPVPSPFATPTPAITTPSPSPLNETIAYVQDSLDRYARWVKDNNSGVGAEYPIDYMFLHNVGTVTVGQGYSPPPCDFNGTGNRARWDQDTANILNQTWVLSDNTRIIPYIANALGGYNDTTTIDAQLNATTTWAVTAGTMRVATVATAERTLSRPRSRPLRLRLRRPTIFRATGTWPSTPR